MASNSILKYPRSLASFRDLPERMEVGTAKLQDEVTSKEKRGEAGT